MQTTPLTTAEAAKRLGVSVPTISRWAREGRIVAAHKLPGVRGPRLFDPAEIDRLTQTPGAHPPPGGAPAALARGG